MKLYRHYKNKPYRYIGVARHSESLDEVVVYETLYENALGRLWVRPKSMFFETIEVDGEARSRFESVRLRFDETSVVRDADLEAISAFLKETIGSSDLAQIRGILDSKNKHYLITAFDGDRPVGFQLGFEADPSTFRSWLGGVHPDFRGLGVASDLIAARDEWCRLNGYRKILAKVPTRFREGVVFHLKKDFEIVGCEEPGDGEIEIVLQKALT